MCHPMNAGFVATVIAACLCAQGALAQQATRDPSRPLPESSRSQYQLGEACQRRTDNHRGVVKVDACGRWYCGRVDVNDITVLNPRFAEDMGCTWQLVEKRCKCVAQ